MALAAALASGLAVTPPALAASEPLDPRFQAYLDGEAYRGLISAKLDEIRAGLEQRCDGPVGIGADPKLQVLVPAEFAEGRPGPVAGRWQLRYQVSGCDHMQFVNYLVAARGDGSLRLFGTAPGTTRTEIALQHQVLNELATKAAVEAPDGCNPLNAGMPFNTDFDRYLSDPQESPDGNVQASWLETWTLYLCGEPVPFQVLFTRNDPLGTDFRIDGR